MKEFVCMRIKNFENSNSEIETECVVMLWNAVVSDKWSERTNQKYIDDANNAYFLFHTGFLMLFRLFYIKKNTNNKYAVQWHED